VPREVQTFLLTAHTDAAAPASVARRASSRLAMQQTLTGGPARGAFTHRS
jgi:hypothetical protein